MPIPKQVVYAIEKRALKKLMKLPKPAMRLLAGKPKKMDGNTLNLPLQMLLKYFSPPPNHLASVAETRDEIDEQGAWLSQDPHSDIEEKDFTVPVENGQIQVRRYRKKTAQGKQRALVFYHGGGYAAGSLISHNAPCHHLAVDADCTVIAVEYRLAPENSFPTPVNDGVAAYRYIAENADLFDIDPSRLGIGGDSAVGNLTAVVAQQTVNDTHKPILQMLWVPWVDMTTERDSYEKFATGFFLERAKMRWYTEKYAPNPEDRKDPKCSPIFGDMTNLPKAMVMVGGFDPLRDEGIEYAEKMKTAGVDVNLKVYTSLPHPFINIAGYIDDAKVAFNDATKFITENL